MEGEAVHRALALAQLAGAKVLLFHQSCAEGVRELRQAQARGQPALGEVCIQYLALTDAEYQADTPRARSLAVSPPLRDAGHQAALWAALADGTLDLVSTDHNPRRVQGNPPIQPPGTSSVEVRLALLHTLGVRTGRLSRQRWVEVCCARPAEVFGLARKGRLEAGCDADLVLFDPLRQLTLTPASLHSPLDFCTYQDMVVTGFPVTTLSRGQVLVRDGHFVGRPGHGRFIPRS
jgi:dihydropyrimidinase